MDNTRSYARVSHSRQWSNYNIISYHMPLSIVDVCFAVYVTIVVLCILGLQALLGLSHRRYQLLAKVFPSSKSRVCDFGQDGEAVSHHERMQEFHLL